MDKRMKITVIGILAAVLILLVIIGAAVVKKLTPSDEVMLITDYYHVEDSEVMVILQDEKYDKKGYLADKAVYLDYDTIIEIFNHRFYWDGYSNILTYTTPTEIVRATVGSSEYSVTKTLNPTTLSADYQIVRIIKGQVYVALDFVRQYSDIEFTYYDNPSRVIINYRWGEQLFTEVTKATQLRYEPNIKSPILAELTKGEELMYADKGEAPEKGFSKVMTGDGIIGYIRNKYAKESYFKTVSGSYKEPEYTSQTRAGKIGLVFHQVFNTDTAGSLEELINATQKVNTIVPTWFSLTDTNGSLLSLASEDYVQKANELGLEVWALVSNVNEVSKDVDMHKLLSNTKARDNLSNALIQAALDYKLNGINIDFEQLQPAAGIHYIQFLRELSVKCRNNGIVLSVDNYVPAPYNSFYDREEQGKILDYVIVMAYDEYYSGSEVAGPVASIGFVEDAITNTLKEVPKEKTVIAIPFYTRLWKETAEGLTSEALAMSRAAQILEENGAKVKWDIAYGCNYAEYKKDGATYKMWQEEELSIEEKMKVIHEAGTAGFAAWKLGLEKESIWDVIERYMD